ncbi:hypothetical protein PR370_15805 [Mycobacterium marinum]|uniref:hypothetical protein n=1 Tax=Mycobacterium marinum TaxID=1781 RepID=UPI002359EA6B|nr:hypothetical protein [Mycobacterium marinum]MDC8982555.1 hypothetical protein [Mycobacterium marinum]MDC8999069.1 hypothetical protein [Mycobacterium marinum]MDC9011509.1 hypothetical protein [Mycobacterium marinum]
MSQPKLRKSARELYEEMRADAPREAVLRTAVEELGVQQADADLLFDGFLQWLAALPSHRASDTDNHYVMLKSDIDRIFHAFILNTSLYRDFCDKHLGHFVDHHPVIGDGDRADVESTVRVLRACYGEDLNPFLVIWERSLDQEAWKVSCN